MNAAPAFTGIFTTFCPIIFPLAILLTPLPLHSILEKNAEKEYG
jgi:hypothetical protein